MRSNRGITTVATVAALIALAGCSAGRFDVSPVFSFSGDTTAASADPYERGKAYLKEGRTVRAIQSLHLALVDRPRSIPVINALAVAYEEVGRHDLAVRYFDRALDVDPGSSQTLNNLGYTALRHGRTEQAQAYFQRALQVDDRNATVLANLGLVDQADDAAEQRRYAVVVREPTAIRQAGWVERTSPFVQTIVTRPDPKVLAAAEQAGVAPQLISFTSR